MLPKRKPKLTMREEGDAPPPPLLQPRGWHRSRPPAWVSGSSNYSTFSASSRCRRDAPLGLSTRAARSRLLRALERQVAEKERSANFTREFRDPFALLLVLCAAFRFTDAARKHHAGDVGAALAPLGDGVFLVAAAAANALLTAAQKRRHHQEIAGRVRAAVADMVDTNHSDKTHSADGAPAWLGTAIRSAHLLPSTSFVACYRDNQWQRLPMNLLVEGDVVGLMSGDVAPGQVRVITDQQQHQETGSEPQVVIPRGSKIPSWSSQFAETTRCNATFNPALLLELCGEMRMFEMLETPAVSDIEDALFRINRPETYTQKLQAKARLIAVYVCTLYSVLVLVAIGMRVVLQHRSLYMTLNHILIGPIGIWLCFASLNTPFVLFLAEAVATASILGSFEGIVLPDKSKKKKPARSAPDGANDDSSGGSADAGGAAANKTGAAPTVLSSNDSQDDGAAGVLNAAELATHESDIYDFEDREKMRSEKASKQSAMRRSLEYFLVALRFRTMNCVEAHAGSTRKNNQGIRLPIPFRSFRLLERLGSTTMLCCFDDEILCEQTPSVEEIFLLNDKQGGSSTVLDLHPERDCETGLKFEDPKWRQHLPSLKPIGLAIMLNDAEDPAAHYNASLRYLVNETFTHLDDASTGGVRDPYLRTCMQRLSAHVRMLPFPTHLLNLSREMGFVVEDDLRVFQRQQSIHIICPRLAHHEHTTDHHDQGQDDTRYRGNLKTHLYSTVVNDKRTNRHQLLSRGHPTIVLTQCSEYWDGKSICPLTGDKRRMILEMYNQWRVEDLDCVALSYVPVPHKLNAMFSRASKSSPEAQMLSGGLGYQTNEMLPPVYLVDDSTAGDTTSSATDAVLAQQRQGHGSGVASDNLRQPDVSPVASLCSTEDKRFGSRDVDVAAMNFTASSSNSFVAASRRSISPTARQRVVFGGGVTLSDVASSVPVNPSETGSSERDSMLWRIQEDQIFLGMVAAGVQPKKGIPDFIEDLTACGIRFVYFSPRNMRRSKLLAEKMGIETDWNCAISLRPLDSDGPDPHRMTSNYSDWDVKARLPHGVEAIKRHLEEVDNVPLLVSLYTDSTPETISEMISIFQENNEVVMGVGSSLKESNAALFSKADTAVALQGDAHTFFDEKLPKGKELPMLSYDDMEFSHILNTLACSFRIRSNDSNGDGNTDPGDNAAPSLTHLIELIRLGRCVLTNFRQMIAFIFVSQLFLATLILASYVVPFPLVPQLSCASIFWLLWVLVPAVSLSMLASGSEKNVMKQTPRKNEEIELQEDLPRLAAYFVVRHLPSALVSILVFECLLGFSLEASREQLGDEYVAYTWIDFIMRNSTILARPRPPAVDAAVNRAEAGMLLVIGFSIVASSCGYLHRCESIFSMSPLRNRIWLGTCALVVCVQLVISVLRAGIEGGDGFSLWWFVSSIVPWLFWLLALIVWPLTVIAVDEVAKAHDRRHMTRYYKFLRMQFDTRLGMWSPK